MENVVTLETHRAAVVAFLNYNGQRGTAKQIDRAMRSFPLSQHATLARLLAERKIVVPSGQ